MALNNKVLKKANFWVFSVLTKIVPCLLLTYLIIAIYRILIKADKRKNRLNADGYSNHRLTPSHNDNLRPVTEGNHCLNPSQPKSSSPSSFKKSSNRIPTSTTRMLIAVLFIFLITEFPSGILSLVGGILGDEFIENVYNHLGELIDILSLFNSSVNFLLYCSMSQQFRVTFKKIFCTPPFFPSSSLYQTKPEMVVSECTPTNLIVGRKTNDCASHSEISVV